MGRPRGRPARRTPPLPRKPRAKRAAPTFDAIVEAAARVLVAHGVTGLTTNRVADVAGVSIGSLYQYFPNKEAIVSALFDRCLTRIAEVLRTAMDESTSMRDMGQRLGTGMLQLSPTERAVFGHLWELRSAADAHDRIRLHNEQLVAHLAAALRRLDLARDDHAHELAYVIVYSGDGLANALARTPSVDVTRAAMIYIDLVMRYLDR